MKHILILSITLFLGACNHMHTTHNHTPDTIHTASTVPTTHIKMTVDGADYVPNSFTVPVNTPIKWSITNNAAGCMTTIKAPELGIETTPLGNKGDTIDLTFTATEAKEYRFTCSMGMGDGVIKAVNTDK